MKTQTYNSYQYSYNLGAPRHERHLTTSPKELKHIAVAAALVMAIGVSIGLYGNFFGGFSFTWTVVMMVVFAVIMTGSFLTHEVGHKIMAQKSGLWAEFRLTTWGAALTLISVFLPFRMISPGAMMIAGTPNGKELVKISLAGPIVNMIFASALLGIAFSPLPATWSALMFFAAYINAFMAIFNLVPFGILDGYKIFSFDKKAWAIAFSVSIVLTIIAVIYTF